MKKRHLIIFLMMFFILGGDVFAQTVGPWVLKNPDWLHVCQNGEPLAAGLNCNGLDIPFGSYNGSSLVEMNGQWNALSVVSLGQSGQQAVSLKVDWMAKNPELNCSGRIGIVARLNVGGTVIPQSYYFDFSMQAGVTKLSSFMSAAPSGGTFIDVQVFFLNSTCYSPYFIDEIGIFAAYQMPTPTGTPLATPTGTPVPYIPNCQGPTPVATVCYPGATNYDKNIVPNINKPFGQGTYTEYLFPTAYSKVSTDSYLYANNTIVAGACGYDLQWLVNGVWRAGSWVNFSLTGYAAGTVISGVRIRCGNNRAGTLNYVGVFGTYPGGTCMTPQPTPVCAATYTPTPRPSTPTMTPNATQMTATAMAPPTAFASPGNPSTGTAAASGATVGAGTAQAGTSAVSTATAAAGGTGTPQPTVTRLFPTSTPPPPKLCENYRWACPPGESCYYYTYAGHEDPICTLPFGFSNVACPVGYVPSDELCGVITPTPGSGSGGSNPTPHSGTPIQAPGSGVPGKGDTTLVTPGFGGGSPGGLSTPSDLGGGSLTTPQFTPPSVPTLSTYNPTVVLATPDFSGLPGANLPTPVFSTPVPPLVTPITPGAVCTSWIPVNSVLYFGYSNPIPSGNLAAFSPAVNPFFAWPMVWGSNLVDYPLFNHPMPWSTASWMPYEIWQLPLFGTPPPAQYPVWSGFPEWTEYPWIEPINPDPEDYWFQTLIDLIVYYGVYLVEVIKYYGGMVLTGITWVVKSFVIIIFYVVGYMIALLYDYFAYALWVVWWLVRVFVFITWFVLKNLLAFMVNWLLKPLVWLLVTVVYLLVYVVAFLLAALLNWLVKPVLFLAINGFYLIYYFLRVFMVWFYNLFLPLFNFLWFSLAYVLWGVYEVVFILTALPRFVFTLVGYFFCNLSVLFGAILLFFKSILNLITSFRDTLAVIYCSAGASGGVFTCPDLNPSGLTDLWGCEFADIQSLLRNALTSSYYLNWLWKIATFLYALRIVRDAITDLAFLPSMRGGGYSVAPPSGEVDPESGVDFSKTWFSKDDYDHFGK